MNKISRTYQTHLLLLLVLSLLFVGYEIFSLPVAQAQTGASSAWTAMLYLNGDNNLCSFNDQIIEQMENDPQLADKIGPDGFLTIVVLRDRNPESCDTGESSRFVVQHGGAYVEGQNHWEMGELNMGDPQTLTDFVTWTRENYPADHYYLSIDSHGGGITGSSWDHTNDRDGLSHAEVRQILQQVTNNGQDKLDLFAYEACLMGLYETAYDLHEFTDYLFFFPTMTWTNTYAYTDYMNDARFTAETDGYEFGNIIFDSYFEHVTSSYAVTLVDTSQMDSLQTAVDAWADALSDTVMTSHDSLTTARQLAQKIDTDFDGVLDERDQHLDLWDLADKTAEQGIAVEQAEALKAAIEQVVVRTDNHSRGDRDYTNIHGIAIYWPAHTSGWYNSYTDSDLYQVSSDGTWDDFLKAYNNPNEPLVSGEQVPTQAHTIFLPAVQH